MTLGQVVRRMALVVSLGLVGFLVLACAAAYLVQGRMIFPAPASGEAPSAKGGTLLRLPAESGEVVALHLPGPPGAATAVFFHGNAEELADTEDWARSMRAAGLGALSVEYPGYGLARASGPPSESGCYAAAEAALTHLRERAGVPAAKTTLVGHSLGTGVATEMARRGHGARLVLLSPYTSMMDVAHELFPYLPTRLLLRHRFDTIAKAPGLSLPVLIVHGAKDQVVPVFMGERLGRVFPSARLIVLPAAGHDVISPRQEALAAAIAAFAEGRPFTLE